MLTMDCTDIFSHFRDEDKLVLLLIFKCDGSIFGGYLRDSIAGETPSDIDVAMLEKMFGYFIVGMTKLGYTAIPTTDNGEHWLFEPNKLSSEQKIKVEVILYPDTDIGLLLGPTCDPDFTVNTLAFDGRELYLWCDNDEFSITVSSVIEDIKNKESRRLIADEERETKLIRRGYLIYN